MKIIVLITPIILLGFFAAGCNSETRPDQDPAKRDFSVQSLAKGDIDSVLDIHVHESRKLLRILMVKLYKRNPDQLKKSPFNDIEKICHVCLISTMAGHLNNWIIRKVLMR